MRTERVEEKVLRHLRGQYPAQGQGHAHHPQTLTLRGGMHEERSVHEQISRCADWRTERLEEEVLQHLRGAILHKDREVLIINKPAGLPVQGGDAICVSVDSLLPQLTFGAAERPRCSPGPHLQLSPLWPAELAEHCGEISASRGFTWAHSELQKDVRRVFCCECPRTRTSMSLPTHLTC